MIILITGLIIVLCFIGAAMAFSLSAQSGKDKKWEAGTELFPTQKPYSHVETGPDSSFPPCGGIAVRETNDSSRKED